MGRMMLITGIGALAFGIAELVWAVRANAARSLVAQALLLAESGAMFVLVAVVPEGPARLAAASVGALAIISAAIMLVVLSRRERRAHTAQGNA